VDVTGIEAVTPCLQSTRLDSIRSIHYFQLLRFPINRGTKLPTCLNHSIRRSWPAFSDVHPQSLPFQGRLTTPLLSMS
jgi:hypothetical protein